MNGCRREQIERTPFRSKLKKNKLVVWGEKRRERSVFSPPLSNKYFKEIISYNYLFLEAMRSLNWEARAAQHWTSKDSLSPARIIHNPIFKDNRKVRNSDKTCMHWSQQECNSTRVSDSAGLFLQSTGRKGEVSPRWGLLVSSALRCLPGLGAERSDPPSIHDLGVPMWNRKPWKSRSVAVIRINLFLASCLLPCPCSSWDV